VSDVKVVGGTFNDSQDYGMYLANHKGTAVINAHFENNWRSVGAIADGGAGLKIVDAGVIIGVYGTTTMYQRYVVEVYAGAANSVQIIGGFMAGSTVDYAYINGGAASNVNIIGDVTYTMAAGGACSVHRDFQYSSPQTKDTSGIGEDDLNTYTVQGGSMGGKGGLRIIAAGTKTNSNDNKTLKLHFGGSSYTFHAAANNTNDWRVEAIICNDRDSETVQRISWVGYDGTTILQGFENAAIDTTSDVTLKITGECAHADDTIRQQIWVVDRL